MSIEPITLNVDGMDCANCALGITRKLVKGGAENVNVNFATGEASFCPTEKLPLEQAVKAIESLGYRVTGQAGDVQESGGITTTHKFWFSLIFTLPQFTGHMFFPHEAWINQPYVQLGLCFPVFLTGAWHFGRSALASLRTGVPNMDVLIFTGSTAAFGYSIAGFFISSGMHDIHRYLFFETSATIITLVLLGNLIEQRSVKRTTTALTELTRLQPEKARRVDVHGDHEHIREVAAPSLQNGDLVQVLTGDRIPADGIIISGEGSTDESMISGESMPVSKIAGNEVIGGTLLQHGTLRVRITATGSQTILSGIIRLVKQAQQEKPPIQQLGDRVSAIFVPAVLGVSLLTFLIAWLGFHTELRTAIMNSVAVLVISCPCAMGLAAPTAVMVGVGRAARRGIIIRGGRTLEELGRAQIIVFDKTGTLTTGRFRVKSLHCNGIQEAEAKAVLLGLERHSSHPLAQSITNWLESENIRAIALSQVEETRGTGIRATDEQGVRWEAGSWRLHQEKDKTHDVYLFRNGICVAGIDLEDELKTGVEETIRFLHGQGLRTVLLSGDRKSKCEAVASRLGINEVFAEQRPEEKTALITRLRSQGKTIMVGDGINDAPALAASDIGISLGEATAVAIAQAQVVLLGKGDLKQLSEALLIGKHSLLTIKQNFFWAFLYNIIAIPIAASGFLSPMIGALSMAFSDVIVIGNSIRLRSKKLR